MHSRQVLLLLLFQVGCNVSGDDGCRSPQYLELGKKGTLSCSFSEDYYGVFWYNSTSYENDRPFLYYKEREKTGRGYTSGEFDIYQNGSLIINNVSMEHEHFFTAFVIKKKDDDTRYPHEVIVVVTVKPVQDGPLIKECIQEPKEEVCYIQSDDKLNLSCYVGDSRPQIPLMWVKRTLNTDKNISFEAYFSTNGIVKSSFANLTYVFNNSECLVLLACKTVEDASMLRTQEALVLAECPRANYISDTLQISYVEVYSTVTLECTSSLKLLLVWKRHQAIGGYKTVAFAVDNGGNFSHSYLSNLQISNGRSLFIKRASYEDEGIYTCVFGTDTSWGMTSFNVTVYANLSSVTFQIEGCDMSEKCEIQASKEGNLTCKILGVHPIAQLTWLILTNDSSEGISFFNESNTIIQHAEVYDISLKVRYVITDTKRTKIVKCKVSGPNADIFPFEGLAHLTVSQGEPTEETYSTKAEEDNSKKTVVVGLLLAGTLLVVFIVSCFFLAWRQVLRVCRGEQTGPHQPEEDIPMLTNPNRDNEVSTVRRTRSKQLEKDMANISEESDYAELIEIMKRELQGKYRSLYNNISPFLKNFDAGYSIATIFIDCSMAVLHPKRDLRNKEPWAILDSYHDIFRKGISMSTRCILKAYPGYGKSTLALKLAYDWSEKKSNSFAKDEELFILLSMSQLDGFSNIYQAVRRILLPKDSKLSEKNIEEIFFRCNSLSIVFDDFEEYPDKKTLASSDILSIIKGDIFQSHKVIVTTRSFQYTEEYNIKGEKIRLTGFDHIAREAYMKQAFQNSSSGIAKILQQLEQNPALCDLCEIPLFFAAYAHMPREYEQFQELNTITKVVSYLMKCFEKHAQERYSKEKSFLDGRTTDRNEYRKLDKVAFESLVGQSSQVWSKTDLCRLIDENLYNNCIHSGLLIEEERFNISNNLDCREQENYTYQTTVRFHHKLFCEWHAAYYVIYKIKQSRKMAGLNETLSELDPSKFELVYLFACGLYPDGTDKITKFLRKQPDTSALIMQCIYEQTGDVSDIKDALMKMCEKPVIFYNKGKRLMQNTTLKLLPICSDNQINITAVWCYNCIDHDKCSDHHLALGSGAPIPILHTLKELMIYSEGKIVTTKNVAHIFKYAAGCSTLAKLELFGQLMPLTFTGGKHFVQLQEKNVEVAWIPITAQAYVLNLQSCKWQEVKEGTVLEQDEYSQLEKDFRTFWNLDTADD